MNEDRERERKREAGFTLELAAFAPLNCGSRIGEFGQSTESMYMTPFLKYKPKSCLNGAIYVIYYYDGETTNSTGYSHNSSHRLPRKTPGNHQENATRLLKCHVAAWLGGATLPMTEKTALKEVEVI